ncbi:VWA-like domain-containing protein [uncultured Desulfuromonas sp.]|uniref:vWA domain-containing protein n=1 Tax=uncultured Desulfuromonas sp. TaxID=181013 RepID=UPI00260546C0|nr:VWA-like domain-containing protein [uncultured Desulfuromonas sp.]
MRNLQNAIVRLLKARPFYGHFLLGFRRLERSGPAPLGVTLQGGTPTLRVCPERFAAHSGIEQSALLEHIIKHILHLHPVRREGRHPLVWDLACDLAVNPSIEGLPAAAALPEPLALEAGLAAEDYYGQLCRSFDIGNLDGPGIGDAGQDDGRQAGRGREESEAALKKEARHRERFDDHREWEQADSTPVRLAEEVVRQMVREAWQRSDGEVPGDVRPLVEGLLAPSPVPWMQVLRQFVATAGRVGRQGTWMRQHRRFAHDTPGIRKRRRLNLLVGIDVSDSTDVRELREAFARELLRIARGRDSQITVLYAGSRIQRVESFKGRSAVSEVYEGGGFTDLRPVFDHARGMNPPPAAVIYLTDGYGEAPERMEFPTLWVLTGDGRMPADWGVELRLDV